MLIDLSELATFSRKIPYERFPTEIRALKLQEEVGEFSEATLVHYGWIKKELKEPQVGELADVIICAVDTYISSHPQVGITQLIQELQQHLDKKMLKWKSKYPDLTE